MSSWLSDQTILDVMLRRHEAMKRLFRGGCAPGHHETLHRVGARRGLILPGSYIARLTFLVTMSIEGVKVSDLTATA